MPAVLSLVLRATIAALVFTAGCGNDSSVPPSRLTDENIQAIHNGMSKVQVIQILGRWREEIPDVAGKAGDPPNALLHCRWKDASKQVDITFDGDKVISKSATELRSPL
jgi:outer membrane protein assembly factor BamE (lipoprotein component of BamABCDE complex)